MNIVQFEGDDNYEFSEFSDVPASVEGILQHWKASQHYGILEGECTIK